MVKYYFSLAFLLFIFSNSFSQNWIDKNEDENYLKRHECAFVQSGNRFIMFGGREQAKRLDIFDYTTNKWSQGAPAPLEFNHFQATEYDGLIWVIGAFKTNNFPNEVPAENVYIYNPALNFWIKGPKIPLAMKRGGAGLIIKNNKFYLVAGNTMGHNGGFTKRFDLYDPLVNKWKQLIDAPRERDNFTVAIIDNKLYAASGRKSGGMGGVFAPIIKEVDVYDFATSLWSTLESSQNIPTARAGASVVNYNDELFVIGGEGESAGPAFKKVEAYNPSTNSWSTKTDLNFPRHGTQAIVSGKGIFIAGGSPNQGGGRQHNMEVYNVDKPEGVKITASTLNSISEVEFAGVETQDVVLSSSGGNAGNFITDAIISGPDATSFMITSTIKNHLIKSNTSQNLLITSNTTDTNKSAKLKITYDNKKTIDIKLKIVAERILSIDDLDLVTSISVSPLPVSDILKIKTKKKIASIEIYDLSGNLVVGKFIKVNDTHVVDLIKLNSDIYLIKVKMASQKTYHRRIMKT
mgnify:CR=1 FL=1